MTRSARHPIKTLILFLLADLLKIKQARDELDPG
jgi:hypothetical protein